MNVRVCFKCKEYTPIHPGNSINYNIIQQFEFMHYKHPVQTLSREEIPKDFKVILLVKIGGGLNFNEI